MFTLRPRDHGSQRRPAPSNPGRVDRFEVGGFVASFVVTPPPRSETLFIGLYEVLTRGECEAGSREPFTGIDVTGLYRYEMAYDNRLDEYKERLVVDWGPGTRSWVQLASHQPKPVRAPWDQQEPPFPGFGRFCVDVHELPGIYPSWQSASVRSRESTCWWTRRQASST